MIRKRVLSAFLAAAIVFPTAAGMGGIPVKAAKTDSEIQLELFVSQTGNDVNAGTEEAPFATVERAQAEVRKYNDDMNGDIVVNIGAGDYYLEDTIVFTEEDSGTNGFEVIYRSVDGIGAANLIGGEQITGWVPTTEEDVAYDLDESLVGTVYKVQLDP